MFHIYINTNTIKGHACNYWQKLFVAGDADKYGKKAMEHLGGMLWLLKTHSEAG